MAISQLGTIMALAAGEVEVVERKMKEELGKVVEKEVSGC